MVFVGLFTEGGRDSGSMLTLDAAIDEFRKMTDRVGRSPARLGSDGKLCYYRCLEYDFLAFLSCFLLFFLFLRPYPGMSVSQSVTPHDLYLSRMHQDGHCGY